MAFWVIFGQGRGVKMRLCAALRGNPTSREFLPFQKGAIFSPRYSTFLGGELPILGARGPSGGPLRGKLRGNPSTWRGGVKSATLQRGRARQHTLIKSPFWAKVAPDSELQGPQRSAKKSGGGQGHRVWSASNGYFKIFLVNLQP